MRCITQFITLLMGKKNGYKGNNMVRFHTLQEKFGLSCMSTNFLWYITVRGTPKVSAVVIA